MSEKKEAFELYDIESLSKVLPKGYRIHTYFADREGPAKIVINISDRVTIQCKSIEKPRFFGLFPRWTCIGEFPPSFMGLTRLPAVAIYKKYEEHLGPITEALKNTPFKVYLAGGK
ncbi:hypothetical protein ACFLZ4_02435 [Patescibacteria group bacterium]